MVVEDGSELAAELWGSAYPEGRAALRLPVDWIGSGVDEHRKALVDFEELYATWLRSASIRSVRFMPAGTPKT